MLGREAGNAAVYLWSGVLRSGVIKAYRSERTYRQERHAYHAWLGDLKHVPAPIAFRDLEPFALLLEYIPGRPLGEVTASVAAERDAHRRAGAWLRGLHGVPFVDSDPMPVAAAYRARLAGWLERSRSLRRADTGDTEPVVTTELAHWLTDRLDRATPRLTGSRRVPCHRDWEPRNWLVDDDHEWVAAIDFEHARPDHPLADLSRLAAYVWPVRPDLRDAFETGYAAPWGEPEELAIDMFAGLEAAQRWVWGHAHDDPAMCASAHVALIALGAPV